jgi:hypothetical protein|nr:MAG: putative cysteine protease [Lake Baikal virophage 7]
MEFLTKAEADKARGERLKAYLKSPEGKWNRHYDSVVGQIQQEGPPEIGREKRIAKDKGADRRVERDAEAKFNPLLRLWELEEGGGKGDEFLYDPKTETEFQRLLVSGLQARKQSGGDWSRITDFDLPVLQKTIPTPIKSCQNKIMGLLKAAEKRGDEFATSSVQLPFVITTQLPRTPKTLEGLRFLVKHPSFRTMGDPEGVTFGTQEYIKYGLANFLEFDAGRLDEMNEWGWSMEDIQENWDRYGFWNPDVATSRPKKFPEDLLATARGREQFLSSAFIPGLTADTWVGEDPHKDLPSEYPPKSRYTTFSFDNPLMPFKQRKADVFVGVFDGRAVSNINDEKTEPFASLNDFSAKDQKGVSKSGRQTFEDVLELGFSDFAGQSDHLIRRPKMRDGITARPFSSNMFIWGSRSPCSLLGTPERGQIIVGSEPSKERGRMSKNIYGPDPSWRPQNLAFWDGEAWFQDFHGYYSEAGTIYGLDGVAIGDVAHNKEQSSRGIGTTSTGTLPKSTLLILNAANDHIERLFFGEEVLFDLNPSLCFPELVLDSKPKWTLKGCWEKYFAGDKEFGFPATMAEEVNLRDDSIPTASCYWDNPAVRDLTGDQLRDYIAEDEDVAESVEEEDSDATISVDLDEIDALLRQTFPSFEIVDNADIIIGDIIIPFDGEAPQADASDMAEILGIIADAREDQAVGVLEAADPPLVMEYIDAFEAGPSRRFAVDTDDSEGSDTDPADLAPPPPPPSAARRFPTGPSGPPKAAQSPFRHMSSFRALPPPPASSIARPPTPPASPQAVAQPRSLPKRRPPRRRRGAFSQAQGAMRGANPNRIGWRYPRKPYGSHRRLLPIIQLTKAEEERMTSEVPRHTLVKSVLDWADDNNRRFRPSITREHKGTILNEIRHHNIPVLRGGGGEGYYGDGQPPKPKGIEFEKLKWGSFSKQAAREGLSLPAFAHKVLSAPKGEYFPRTRRRANFYLSVIKGGASPCPCPETGLPFCRCPEGTPKEVGGRLPVRDGANLMESVSENPEVKEIIADPMDDRDIRAYYPNAVVMKYEELAAFPTIDALLPKNKDIIFLLYQHSFNNGHWVLLSKYGNTFEFFCSYGSKIDEPLTWTRESERAKLGEDVPFLTHLVKKWKGKVAVNRKQFQVKGSNVATCGAYCVARGAALKNDDMDLAAFQGYMEELKKETGLSYDEIVANFVSQR